MISVALMVATGPGNESVARSVIGFVTAALAAGCTIDILFFNHDGAYWADGARYTATDDYDPVSRVIELAQPNGIELIACSAAAQRRGVLDPALAAESGQPSSLRDGFSLAGLGHWCESAARADRVVQIG